VNIQVIVIDRTKSIKTIINIRPIAKTWQFDRMSIILEKRDIQTNECLEVWHLQIEHETGKIVHRDRKYPLPPINVV